MWDWWSRSYSSRSLHCRWGGGGNRDSSKLWTKGVEARWGPRPLALTRTRREVLRIRNGKEGERHLFLAHTRCSMTFFALNAILLAELNFTGEFSRFSSRKTSKHTLLCLLWERLSVHVWRPMEGERNHSSELQWSKNSRGTGAKSKVFLYWG